MKEHAFPSPVDPKTGTNQLGITVRDYFAVKCFSKLGSFPETIKINYDGLVDEKQRENFRKYIKSFSEMAYEMADAMLEARK